MKTNLTKRTLFCVLLLSLMIMAPAGLFAQQATTVNGGVLNGKAKNLPLPAYPETARKAKAAGTVVVEIVIDETGKVTSAEATSGHSLLLATCTDAARKAEFAPSTLDGQPIRVKGVLMYQFQASE
jgi:TonB family protein